MESHRPSAFQCDDVAVCDAGCRFKCPKATPRGAFFVSLLILPSCVIKVAVQVCSFYSRFFFLSTCILSSFASTSPYNKVITFFMRRGFKMSDEEQNIRKGPNELNALVSSHINSSLPVLQFAPWTFYQICIQRLNRTTPFFLFSSFFFSLELGRR